MKPGERFGETVSNTEGGTLARLWKNIIIENGLVPAIPTLVKNYTNRTIKMDVKNVKRKTKSSLLNNINAPEMTWRVFLNLMFSFLHVRKIDITIKSTFSNGDERIQHLTINNSDTKNKGNKDAKK